MTGEEDAEFRSVDNGPDTMLRPVLAIRSARRRAVAEQGWVLVRRIVAVLYFAALLVIVLDFGVPTGRKMIAGLVVTGLCITRIGRGWRPLLQVLLDWAPFTLVLILYDKTRSVADAVGMPLHESDIVTAEKWLCGAIPTVWLQEHLYSPQHVYWYDAAVTLVYTSHFIATPLLAAVLWLRERRAWMQYISRVILLSVAGLATYIAFPEAPPWMASRDGLISEHIARLSARGWIWLHAGDVSRALAHAQEAGSNAVAAMPSLHVAFACLVAIAVGSRLRSRWRTLLALYPVAMGFTLVYTGEHYVLDLIAGAAYAIAAHLAMNHWERRRVSRGGTEEGFALDNGGQLLTYDEEDLESFARR